MRLMLSGVAVAALACGATAAPPRGPLSEGREPDPVAREYYHGAPPAPPVERAAPAREPQASGGWAVRVGLAVAEAVIGEVAVPLGPFRANGM